MCSAPVGWVARMEISAICKIGEEWPAAGMPGTWTESLNCTQQMQFTFLRITKQSTGVLPSESPRLDCREHDIDLPYYVVKENGGRPRRGSY
jgi:hypothetical protein